MKDALDEAKAIVKKFNQEHLLNGFEELEDNKKELLLKQILNISKEILRLKQEEQELNILFNNFAKVKKI